MPQRATEREIGVRVVFVHAQERSQAHGVEHAQHILSEAPQSSLLACSDHAWVCHESRQPVSGPFDSCEQSHRRANQRQLVQKVLINRVSQQLGGNSNGGETQSRPLQASRDVSRPQGRVKHLFGPSAFHVPVLLCGDAEARPLAQAVQLLPGRLCSPCKPGQLWPCSPFHPVHKASTVLEHPQPRPGTSQRQGGAQHRLHPGAGIPVRFSGVQPGLEVRHLHPHRQSQGEGSSMTYALHPLLDPVPKLALEPDMLWFRRHEQRRRDLRQDPPLPGHVSQRLVHERCRHRPHCSAGDGDRLEANRMNGGDRVAHGQESLSAAFAGHRGQKTQTQVLNQTSREAVRVGHGCDLRREEASHQSGGGGHSSRGPHKREA